MIQSKQVKRFHFRSVVVCEGSHFGKSEKFRSEFSESIGNRIAASANISVTTVAIERAMQQVTDYEIEKSMEWKYLHCRAKYRNWNQ